MRKQLTRHKNTISTRTLILVFILLFLILSISAVFDYFSRRRTVIDNMTHISQTLANTIRNSTASSIILNNLLNYYIENWFKSNLMLLNEIEASKPINNTYLSKHAEKTKMFHLNVYDTDGNRELYSHPDRVCRNVQDIIAPILKGESEEIISGEQTLRNQDETVFVIAVKRAKGGAIVGSLRAQRFYAIQSVIGIERYLNLINSDSSIVYIAITDSSGIIAKTDNLDRPVQPNLILKQTEADNSDHFQWQIKTFKGKRIFEASVPIEAVNRPFGILHIGLDYSPVANIQKTVFRQGLIRLAVLLIISFILFSYSISIQNIQLLKKEKDKITKEVYSLQHDLRQKEKMSAVGELAAGIAHEIRNPLGAISMTVQRLAREFKPDEDNAERERLFTIIRKEIDHIGNSIKNLLQFSKPAPLRRSHHRIDEIITRIVDLYQEKAAGAGVTLKLSKSATAKEAFIDPYKLEECLINMIENALAATPSGGTITIDAIRKKTDILITIRDDGHGIPEDVLPKIFNLYFTTKANGTGLGLAHAQQIISEHGGTIQVDSRPNKGTTFTITIPGEKNG